VHRLWRDVRLLPAYAAALSVLVALLTFVASSRPIQRWIISRSVKEDDEQPAEASETVGGWRLWLQRLVEDHGGNTIFAYELTRCASVLALLLMYALSFGQPAAGAENGFVGALEPFRLDGKGLTKDGWMELLLCIAFVRPHLLYIEQLLSSV
jgi:hypothetical protein